MLIKGAFFLVLFIALSPCAVRPQVPPHIEVEISIQKRAYGSQVPIHVLVKLRNRSNRGLVVSNVISDSSNTEGYVRFKLTNKQGREEYSQVQMISDELAPFPRQPDWRRLLGKWIVLYPKDTLASHLTINDAAFPFLATPGEYNLSCEYSSAGLSYPMNYRNVGLTAQQVASFRFSSWTGKVQSNSVRIEIVSRAALSK